MAPLLRSFLASVAIVAAIFGVIFATRGFVGQKTAYFDLKVMNDTQRKVTVEQCWDLSCIDTHGLRPSVLPPGHFVHENREYLNDIGRLINVGIRKPGGNPFDFESCMYITFEAGQKTGLVRVSQALPCFKGTLPGAGP